MNCENLHLSHKLNFVYQISTRLCKLEKIKIGICGGLFLAIPDLKLKNLNESSIKNPSYRGDQLIRVKSKSTRNQTLLWVIYSSKRMLNKFA